MTNTQKAIKKLNEKFNSLHNQLLCKGEYDLAFKLSEVYWRVQAHTFKEGIDFMKKINK